MPHTPCGGGCIAPPASPCPSARISIKLLRSSARAIARRTSRLSNGGASLFTIKLVLWFAGATSHTAFGACSLMFFIRGTVIPNGNVRSNWPATKARMAVERFAIIVPDLATKWSWNADLTELTFQVRRGVSWHDGKPFTAADVKCTWDLIDRKSVV